MGSAIATAKKAAVVTAMVLATIYILRRVPVASDLVDRALKG